MSEFVLDCSVAVAWLFEDEATGPKPMRCWIGLMENGALVPWPLAAGGRQRSVPSRTQETHRRLQELRPM